MAKNRLFKDFIIIFIGTLIAGFGMGVFLIPNKLSAGGFTGIATIAYYFLNFDVGKTVIIMNIPFFIWTFLKLGKTFLFKSIFGMISLSLFIDFFEKNFPVITNDLLLASIYGGVLIGIGMGLTFKAHSSTGGSDLIVNICRIYNPRLSTTKLLNLIDVTVVVLNVLFFGNIEIGLYSAIAIFLVGRMIDIIFEGIDFAKLVFIVTENGEVVLKMINTQLDAGATEIYGKGAYSEVDKNVIITAMNRREIPVLREKLSYIDPHAFLVVTNAREVYGLGFKSLKMKV